MVTAEDVEELGNLIGEFEELSENKGSAKSSGVSQTKKLAELFAKTGELLTRGIDPLMVRFKRKNPAFYDSYMNARNIIDL